ncbi:MAG TPA: hypothetical protein VL201_01345 [Patescibacteria group bacterium]|jgi:hypothetical protein|nr:hypothetical protein [Patescibacteria group bacterium]
MKKNVLLYVLFAQCVSIFSLQSALPTWFKNISFLSVATTLSDLTRTAQQLPIGQRLFGVDEQTMLALKDKEIEIVNHYLQQAHQLKQLFKENKFIEIASIYEIIMSYQLGLIASQKKYRLLTVSTK